MQIAKINNQTNFNGWDKSRNTRRTLATEIYKLPNKERAEAVNIIRNLADNTPGMVLKATRKPFTKTLELSTTRYELSGLRITQGINIGDDFLGGLKRFANLVKVTDEMSFAPDEFLKAMSESDLARH